MMACFAATPVGCTEVSAAVISMIVSTSAIRRNAGLLPSSATVNGTTTHSRANNANSIAIDAGLKSASRLTTLPGRMSFLWSCSDARSIATHRSP